MSNRKYRRRPGLITNEATAMIRATALELLDGPLRELQEEIEVVQMTVDLYKAEIAERQEKVRYGGETGRWQVAPGVGLRALAMLRKLREKRDAMIAEAEQDIREEVAREPMQQTQPAQAEEAATEPQPEPAKQTPHKQAAQSQPEPKHERGKTRDPAQAA